MNQKLKMNHTRLLETFVPELRQKLEKALGMLIFDKHGSVILNKKDLPVLTDEQFFRLFKGQSIGQNNYSSQLATKQPDLKYFFGNSIFTYKRQVNIFGQIMDNIEGQLEYRKKCKIREHQTFKEELKKEVKRERNNTRWEKLFRDYRANRNQTDAECFVIEDIENYILTREWRTAQWCTSAFTTEIESTRTYKHLCNVEKVLEKVLTKGISARIVEVTGQGYKIRYSGGRIACSFRKEECAYKKKYEDSELHGDRLAGCLYCELSAEMRLFSSWASEMSEIESFIQDFLSDKDKQDTLGIHKLFKNSNIANEIADKIIEQSKRLTPRQKAMIRLIRRGHFKSLSKLSLEAMDDILEKAITNFHPNHSSLEFLPDGSSLNPDEIPPKILLLMMDKIHKAGYPSMAIETRPEYIINNPEYVKQVIDHWQGDGPFEIYFGLETVDTFVASIINNKGYCKKEFIEAISILQNLPLATRQKVHCSVYKILKSSYMTEYEALKDAEQMIRFVDEMNHTTGIDFSTKVEPAVISHGSMQAALYHKKIIRNDGEKDRVFRPPNYFTVCELLVRSYLKNYRVKIGQRADIDFFDAIPMVWSLESRDQISPIDFCVYYAAQKLAMHWKGSEALRTLCVDLFLAIQYCPEFEMWEKETFSQTGKSLLKDVFEKELANDLTSNEQQIINFQKSVFRSLDRLEFNPSLSKLLREEENNRNSANKELTPSNGFDRIFTFTSSNFSKEVKSIFNMENIIVQTVGEVIPTIVTNGETRFFKVEITIEAFIGSEARNKNNRQTQTIWTQIPEYSTNLTEDDKSEFIYSEAPPLISVTEN